MNDSTSYAVLSRADLLPALLGREVAASRLRVSGPVDLAPSEIAVFFDDSSGRLTHVVVSDKVVQDFFVWLETYAPQFSPITQSLRVISDKDLEFISRPRVVPVDSATTKAFAGVVVGELLAQSASDPLRVLDSMSLSTAVQTFSHAFGRSVVLWGSERSSQLVHRAFEMLQFLQLLPARRIEPILLQPIWHLIEGRRQAGVWSLINDAVESLRVGDRLRESTILQLSRDFEPARELFALGKNTAEDRVLALDRMLDADIGLDDEDALIVSSFCYAYAAVEVGGGTTRHMNLLADISARRPLVWPFFGLVASIGPSEKWHPGFARAAKFVARELSYSYVVADPPRADISIRELAAIAGSKNFDVFLSFPRAQHRAVTIEVAPGVTLNIGLNAKANEAAPPAVPKPVPNIAKLDEAMAALWSFREDLLGDRAKAEPVKAEPRRRSNRAPKGKTGKLL